MNDDDFDLSVEAMRERLSDSMLPDDRVYIVSGNHAESRWHAAQAGLSGKQWVHLGSARSLRGKRQGFRYWLVGGWRAHRDALEILEGLDYLSAVKWHPGMERAA